MPSGGPLHLFFNPNVIPCGPPAAPPPEVGPNNTIIVGLGPYKSGILSATLPTLTAEGVQVGDLLVAFMMVTNCPGFTTMAGGIPAGWTIVREDVNPGDGSVLGQPRPIYTGIAIKIAGSSDVAVNPSAYVFTSVQAMGVAISCVRNTSGIDAISYSHAINGGTLSVAGVACAGGNEKILLLATAATIAGAMYVCAGSSGADVTVNDLPLATDYGSTDSAVRQFYMTGPASPGTSTAHQITQRSPAGDQYETSGYQVSLLA